MFNYKSLVHKYTQYPSTCRSEINYLKMSSQLGLLTPNQKHRCICNHCGVEELLKVDKEKLRLWVVIVIVLIAKA